MNNKSIIEKLANAFGEVAYEQLGQEASDKLIQEVTTKFLDSLTEEELRRYTKGCSSYSKSLPTPEIGKGEG
jgi:hypothetical protein